MVTTQNCVLEQMKLADTVWVLAGAVSPASLHLLDHLAETHSVRLLLGSDSERETVGISAFSANGVLCFLRSGSPIGAVVGPADLDVLLADSAGPLEIGMLIDNPASLQSLIDKFDMSGFASL